MMAQTNNHANVLMYKNATYWLVVWNMCYFSIHWEESSQLTFIFFRGVGIPPTSHFLCCLVSWHQFTRSYRDGWLNRKTHALAISSLAMTIPEMYPQGYPNWYPSVYQLVPNIGEFHDGWGEVGGKDLVISVPKKDQVRQFKEGHR